MLRKCLLPWHEINDGLYSISGGVRAIPEAFIRLAQELGVEIMTGEEVIKINADDRGVTSVETKNKNYTRPISCRQY